MIRIGVFLCVVACGASIPAEPTTNNKLESGSQDKFEIEIAGANGSEQPAMQQPVPVVTELLAREPLVDAAEVKHILISWKELESAYQGRQDPRAKQRSKTHAENVVRSLVDQLRAGADFDVVMKAQSEDAASALSARTFNVTPTSQLVIEFRQLSLRFEVDEIGVCQSDFGFHIIKRIR